MKKLRRLSFEGMSHKLKDPPQNKQDGRNNPKTVVEESSDSNCERDENRGYAVSMAKAVHRMLVAAGISRDPLFAGASANHYCG